MGKKKEVVIKTKEDREKAREVLKQKPLTLEEFNKKFNAKYNKK